MSNKQDQRLLATWAADCAERVLPFFKKAYPKDDRPREAKENDAACFAARAAGQAVATAHVPQHAFGHAYYAFRSLQLILLMTKLKLPKSSIGKRGTFQKS